MEVQEKSRRAVATQWFKHGDHPMVEPSYQRHSFHLQEYSEQYKQLKDSLHLSDADELTVTLTQRRLKENVGEIYVSAYDYLETVRPGDWIVEYEDGELEIVSKEDFDDQFTYSIK